MSLLLLFLRNFAVTAAVEGAAVWLVRRDRRFVFYSLLCNLLTNPAANLVMLAAVFWLGPAAYLPALVLLECAVVTAEAAVYRMLGGLTKRRALRLSLLLNVFSCLAGLVLHFLQ